MRASRGENTVARCPRELGNIGVLFVVSFSSFLDNKKYECKDLVGWYCLPLALGVHQSIKLAKYLGKQPGEEV